jgi:serine protease Do
VSAALSVRASRDRREAASFVAVIILVVVALLAGSWLKTSVDGAVQQVDQGGLAVELPSGWIVLPAAGDRLLTAYDPLDPDIRYGVAAVDMTDPVAGATLTAEDAAARRVVDRSQLLEGFAISSEGPGSLGTVVTYEVHYAFVDQGLGGEGTPIEAIEHYFPAGEIFPGEARILAVVLEAPPDELDAALPAFERFAEGLAGRTAVAAAAPIPVAVIDDGVPRLALAGGPTAGAPAAPAAIADMVGATVQILLVATIGGQEQAYGHGSGTILSPDGLILTNAHVAMPTATGRGVFETDPTPPVDPEDLIVAVIESEDRPPVPMYRATVITADGYLDAAVIRIDRDLAGRPIDGSRLDLPTVPIGDSETLRVGDALTVVGFPGIGGDTISLSSGRVSGFLGDERVGSRAWIKTDAIVSGGNSGGLAANEAGELVGIPTRARDDVGGYSWVRPIALAMPLIEAARAGRRTVDSPYVVAGTGRESLRFDTWTNSQCPPQDRLTAYPSGTTNIVAAFNQSGFAPREDVVAQWRLDGEVVARSGIRLPADAASGGCYSAEIYYDRGLPDGSYGLEVFAGATLRAVGTAQTSIGAVRATGATLSGVVVDADSGRPVVGAVVFLLTPGTDLAAWFNQPDQSKVVSFAKTLSDGTFLINGLTAGTSYPALAMADGYLASGGVVGPMQEGDNSLASPVAMTRVAP